MAILPLRGKVINAEKHAFASLIKNTEIQSMIKASGVGINEDFNLDGLRYHKIIIMADADDDGCHIASLLMTFFFRYMKPLITHGHLYLAVPPLYKVAHGKQKHYAWNDTELADITASIKGKTHIVRYKGLGEMDDDELGWTTMNPKNRRLIRLDISDMGHAERVLSTLMGSSAEARKIHIKGSINSIIAQPTTLAV
jgi:DNA gyrase/topoisomerase IV subunit B